MGTLPRGTITFLFTDIEGSTRLWQEHPEPMRLALARHDLLLRAAIEAHHGAVFKTVGDAFCAAFATARDALSAAVAAQAALREERWGATGPLRVRMALHAGAAEERDGDYFGPPLNRVARLLGAGHGGQVLLSLAAQELVCDSLPPAVALRGLGAHRLKDLTRPEQVYQAVREGLQSEFPPLKSLDALPNNLPLQVTSFIGRETEMAEVKRLLTTTRLLTLTGAGGTGKTRLSLHAATDLLDGFPDGAWFVELAELADPALVPQTAAMTLGVREGPGLTCTRALVEWLKPKKLLLLLDNCEHVLPAAAGLADALLHGCPQVTLLASSRERLNLPGEQTYRVPSLSLPVSPHLPNTAEGLGQYEAVRLFIDRAVANEPGFAVTNENAPAVAQVCQRLDGIPLALELAAARLRALSIEELNARLDQRFRLLTGGSRTALPRQQTLRALIDWSYDLLDDQEQRFLARLSVFAGGWSLAAAEAVCGDLPGAGDPAPCDVLDLLARLVDKSLVVNEAHGDGTRYRLLETIRQYARDRLVEQGRDAEAQRRHLDYFLGLAEEAQPGLRSGEQAAWLARLDLDHDNFRAALDGCRQAERKAAGVRLAALLGPFWVMRGYWNEGRDRLAEALAWQESAAPDTLRADLLNAAGSIAACQGDYPSARALFAESLEIRRKSGERRSVASSLHNLGNVAYSQGDYAGAREYFEQSLELYQEVSQPVGEAASLNSLGVVAMEEGDYEAARGYYERSLELARSIGHRSGEGRTLTNLGNVAAVQGDYGAARALYEQSRAIMREMGSRSLEADDLQGLGNLALQEGDLAAARRALAEALAIHRGLGAKKGIAESLEAFAALAAAEGNGVRAARLWGAAGSLRRQIHARRPAYERAAFERDRAAAAVAIGEDAFSAVQAEGEAMTLDQAVAAALEEDEPEERPV